MRAFFALFGLAFCGAAFGQTPGVTDQRYSHLARGVILPTGKGVC
jgi:hypothetical protein